MPTPSLPTFVRPVSTRFAGGLCTRALVTLTLLAPVACVRAQRDTDKPNMDVKALSTGLDRVDVDYLADETLEALYSSPFWQKDIQGAAQAPVLAVWPIKNATTQHIDDQMLQLLSRVETNLVNGGQVGVVSRERQPEMAQEVWVQNGESFDHSTAAAIAKQVGAKYYVTGKVTASDERLKRQRRVQYTLFVQVLEVETGIIKFQHETIRSKTVKGG